MRTPTWASSEMAPYLQSGKWNPITRAGGRGYQCVYESERVLLCRKTLVWELGSPDHLLCQYFVRGLTLFTRSYGVFHSRQNAARASCSASRSAANRNSGQYG